MSYNNLSQRRKHLKIIFWTLIGCRIIITIYISYRYVISLGSEVEAKGGTFVEGIFGPTSYLPFLATNWQSTFYQGFLFDSCTRIDMQEHGAVIQEEMCQVQTTNNQTFTVTINTGFVWSDGTPVTIDDVYFTYQNILIENQRAIAGLNTYNEINIEKISDTQLAVTFPRRSIDNKFFFTYKILPRHILMGRDFNYYRNEFAQRPVHTQCGQLRLQTNDINSLVFDIGRCTDTNLGFYQIKNIHSFEEFKQDYQLTNRSIIDAYYGDESLAGYIAQPIVTHAYTTVFFNTNSDKMRIRLRRALAGLINYQFYTGNYDKFIRKDQWIFDNFMSTGSNIEEFLTRITPDGTISAAELEESGVKKLTDKTITFNERDRRHAYYINDNPFSVDVEITTAGSYDMLGIKYGDDDKGAISSYNKTQRTAKHTIPMRDIQSGINTFTLYTKDRNQRVINIGSITLYLLDDQPSTTETQGAPETTITIIYQNTAPTQKVVQHLRDIFARMDIEDFFIFMPLANRADMEEELRNNAYDIAIIPIERGLKRDISPILKTDDPITNPSQYTNPQFSNLFEQYIQFEEDNKPIRDQIISIYTRDIPFMILGKQISHIHVKPDIYQQVFMMYTGTVFENSRRNMIYDQLSRARNVHIDTQDIGGPRALRHFIRDTIQGREDDIFLDEFETGTIEETQDI